MGLGCFYKDHNKWGFESFNTDHESLRLTEEHEVEQEAIHSLKDIMNAVEYFDWDVYDLIQKANKLRKK